MRRLKTLLLLAIVFAGNGALAQVPFANFRSVSDSMSAIDVVQRFYAIPDSAYMDSTQILSLVTDALVARTIKALGRPIRPTLGLPWRIDGARMLNRNNDDSAIVLVPTVTDTVPRFGPVTVDLVYYLRRTTNGWRIVDYHRQLLVETAIRQLRDLDSLSIYPNALKPTIAREVSALLLSNAQLRAHFVSNRRAFDSLRTTIQSTRNLSRLARIDRRAEQINNVAIMWQNSAQVVPKEAIREYEQGLSGDDLKSFRAALAQQEKLRKIGDDSVASVTRRLKINAAAVDRILQQMQQLRLVFLNEDLPWKESIQLTVAGVAGHSLGYLYSPRNQLPVVSPDEYFYLEELGNGWWIFRAR